MRRVEAGEPMERPVNHVEAEEEPRGWEEASELKKQPGVPWKRPPAEAKDSKPSAEIPQAEECCYEKKAASSGRPAGYWPDPPAARSGAKIHSNDG